VAQRRLQAQKKLKSLAKKGVVIEPLEHLKPRQKIASSFWGQGWCDHLESYSDYANRLPRGRSYVRNGSVVHLSIKPGVIEAYVQGSELYELKITVKALPAKIWQALQARCRGKIGSLIELLQGKISGEIMAIVTDKEKGLFPHPDEIKLNCSCPDGAYMCKHVAAVLYGVGARLDQNPELLFTLRGVDHNELISHTDSLDLAPTTSARRGRRMSAGNLGEVFGIDLDSPEEQPSPPKVQTKQKNSAKAKVKHPAKPAEPTPFTPTAALVRKLRKQSGLGKTAFARALGVSAPTIDNWERKKGKLNLQTLSQTRLRDFQESL
jgi:uncharacterized Zn finger protein